VIRLLVVEDRGQIVHIDRLLTGPAEVEVFGLVRRIAADALA